MEQARKETVRYLASERTRKLFPHIVPVLLLGFLLIGASFAVGIFFPPSLVLTIPFLVVPSFCSIHRSCDMIETGKEEEGNLFFRGFAAYFTNYFGVYHLLRITGISLLVMLACSTLASVIDYSIELSVNPAFREAMAAMLEFEDSGFIANLAEEDSPLILRETILTTVQGATFAISFFILFARYACLPYIKTVTNAPQRMVLTLFRGGYRKVRREFRRDYWGSLWHLLLFFLLGLAGGYAAFYFIFSNARMLGEQVLSASRWVIGGVGVGLLVLIPLLPYFYSVVGITFHKHSKAFSDYSFELATEALNNLIEQQQINKEEADEMARQIDQAKEEMKRYEEEQKDSSDEDKNSPE